jgi:hypothetical protein
MYEIRENISKDKKEIKTLRSDMDNTDKRSIEILSIFAAIVLFIAGDIQLFTKMTDSILAIKFMFLFGFVLATFVLLIWFITRTDGFRFRNLGKIHFAIMTFFFLGFVFCFGLVRGWFDQTTTSPKPAENLTLENKIKAETKVNNGLLPSGDLPPNQNQLVLGLKKKIDSLETVLDRNKVRSEK